MGIMAIPILVLHTAMAIEGITVTDMIVALHVLPILGVLDDMPMPTTPEVEDMIKISADPTVLGVTITTG
ncbi:MAG: hypothetical protein CBE26_04485 [Kiritimatiellaceae bacterium TMED266]|nr:MAG: hypothetical protein CBE26_04485 [Kiritimatiellaceae bacterium TMED266]